MKEALKVIDEHEHEALFQWPDIIKNELWKVLDNKENK
jgi:hypothetical protein